MLSLNLPALETFDEATNEFVSYDAVTIELEHSLTSLSKWESIFEKPFLGPIEKTTNEILEYIKVMTITPNVPDEVYSRLTEEHFVKINDYFSAKMSATWFNEAEAKKPKNNRQVITSELIYYWMFSLNIPLACQDWHLNRLFTLIKVSNEQNKPEKKMGQQELAARNRELNAKRRANLKTKG